MFVGRGRPGPAERHTRRGGIAPIGAAALNHRQRNRRVGDGAAMWPDCVLGIKTVPRRPGSSVPPWV